MKRMKPKRLAIIGGGSSGLICLKYALDELPNWEIVCFEKTSEVTGCWGRPPRGFVSSSTKYTTQFACCRQYDATVTKSVVADDAALHSPEFFNNDEYGEYLKGFADAFQLDRHIVRNCDVTRIARHRDGDWELTLVRNNHESTERFSAIVVCTGLADQPRPLDNCPIETLRSIDAGISIADRRIVVIGGGESAVDMAQRLSQPELNNRVYLSLQSGIRVSPRYHPIRGVPSDFLRTRLLLSIHEDIRNWLGQKFVEFRMRSEARLRWLFPSRTHPTTNRDPEAVAKRKIWDLKLTRTAKDRLFNMYHNKSDDFLDSVAEGRIHIIGANIDQGYRDYFQFDSRDTLSADPDLIVPAIGYRSTLTEISDGKIVLDDFYLGCAHVHFDNLYLVGFTRPIIGNIPSISEMQARYVSGLISGRFDRPAAIAERHEINRKRLHQRYPRLDTVNVYPVEMFPYCDQLARLMNCYPTLQRVGSPIRWLRMMVTPATTLHYFDDHLPSTTTSRTPVHSPAVITLLLLLIKPFDLAYRIFHRDCRAG